MMRVLRLNDAAASDIDAVVDRAAVADGVRREARAIVDAVRTGGDDELQRLGNELGGGAIPVRVDPPTITGALATADTALVDAIRDAAANVRRVHEQQRPSDHVVEVTPGVSVSRRWSPLRRVGAYVPGGSAPLPSTMIMTVVPAQVAGVAEIAVATPARDDGSVDPVTLAAAAVLGVDELYAMGGAQAIAALAYGTESISRVDKIVGPGNPWVTAAKLIVAAACAVDMPAGPSEALVIADDEADPRFVAADLLAQAEHGPDSPVVLVSIGPATADAVVAEIGILLDRIPRRAVVEKALADHGLVVIADDRDGAASFADRWAPEHLSIHTVDAAALASRVTAAGSVFVGPWAPEPVGDYASGANHVLPTGGLAASTSPLGTDDFGSWRQVQHVTEEGLRRLRPTVTALADAEGLAAHRLAVDVRFES